MAKDPYMKNLEKHIAEKMNFSSKPGKNTRVKPYGKNDKLKRRFRDLGPGGLQSEKATVMQKRADKNRYLAENKYGRGYDAPNNPEIRKNLTRKEKIQGELIHSKAARQYSRASEYRIKGKRQYKYAYPNARTFPPGFND
jgi:hypothetical protein